MSMFQRESERSPSTENLFHSDLLKSECINLAIRLSRAQMFSHLSKKQNVKTDVI